MTASGSADSGGLMATAGKAVADGIKAIDDATSGIPAMIRCIDPTALGLVLFDFNPNQITFGRQPQIGARPNPAGGSSGTILSMVTPPKIGLKQVIFTGETTKLRVDQLSSWAGPPAGLFTLIAGAIGFPVSSNPPVLTFQWGPPLIGFMYSVVITNMQATYTRFHRSGIPIRAEINLDLQVQPDFFGSLPTNPTSGGLPGRSTHLIRDGETLQSVAQQRYGKPGAWRKIAEINGITDPHRVRVGTTVFLPNESEF
jgi:nucleoid-associated protein YgaU